MTARFLLVSAAVGVGILSIAGCGGGSESQILNPLPMPAPVPVPAPTNPPSIDSTKALLSRLPLGQVPPGTCYQGQPCFNGTSAFVDAAGELTVVWAELPTGGPNRLAAANLAYGGTTPLSSGVVESDFAARVEPFTVRPLGNRRFVVMHQYGASAFPAFEPARSRIVDMKTSGAPAVADVVLLPPMLQSGGVPQLHQDSTAQLYSRASFPLGLLTPPPFPSVPLGVGVTLQTTLPPLNPLAQLESLRASDFPESADPRILLKMHGRLLASDDLSMYVAEQRLLDGSVLPPIKVSTQPVSTSNAPYACAAVDVEAQATVGAAATQYLVPWLQLSGAGFNCDLMVNGQRVNSGAANVTNYTVNIDTNGAVVAVWTEGSSALGSWRVLWSRREAGSSAWSTPAPVAPQLTVAGSDQYLMRVTRGPGGTLAIVWMAGNVGTAALVSKYAQGAWSTVQVQGAAPYDARSIVINGSGQGAVLFRLFPVYNGTAIFEELAAYWF